MKGHLQVAALLIILLLGSSTAQEVIISTTSATINEGESFQVTVSLTEAPPPDLTAAVLNSFSPNANQRLSLVPEFFDFSDADFNVPKTLTVTATENNVANTRSSYTLRIFMVIDLGDSTITDTKTISVTVNDNDAAGVTMTGGENRVVLIEGGSEATLSTVFQSQPTEDVTLSFTKLSGAFTLADDILLSPATRTVVPADWAVSQTLGVAAISDLNANEPRMEIGILALSTSSADSNYLTTPGARRFTLSGTSGLPSGTVALIIGGVRTSSLAPGTSASTISSAIAAALGGVGVSTTTSSTATSYTWDVEFTNWIGAVPTISIDTASLTGTATLTTLATAKPPVSPSARYEVVIVDKDKGISIQSAVAANTGNQPGPGVGDTVTVTLSEDSDRAIPSGATVNANGASLTKAQVDSLFTFSASLGAGYTGRIPWETLSATGSVVSGNANAVRTSEDLSFKVKAGDRLRIAGTVYTIDSSFDTRTDLTLIPLTSALQGSGGGLAIQRLSRTQFVITLTDVTGQGTALELRVGVMDVNLPASAGLRDFFSASAPTATTVKLSGTWGAQATPAIVSATAADSSPAAAGISAQDSVTVVFDSATNRPPVSTAQEVANLISWSSPVGNVIGSWTSATTLVLRLQNPSSVDIEATRIGNLRLTLLASGNLRSADESSAVSTDSKLLTGTWGARAAPVITSAVASDPDPVAPGISNGDIITITFDVDTNRPQLSSKEAVDQLITFSSPVGTDYSGAWSSAKVLVITLNAVGTGVDPAATRPDVLSISLKAAGNVKTSDLSSPASTSSATVTGTWGTRPAPVMTQAEARDPSPVVPGISDGDQVTITFDSDTNRPAIGTTAQVNSVFSFSSQTATALSGTWVDARTARLTLTTVPSTVSIPNTRIGALQISVLSTGNLRTADFSSPAASNTVTLVGTWGDWPAPTIVSAVAADTGNSPGVSAGDTIRITFDQNTNQPSVSNGAGVSDVLSFSTSLGSLSGEWESSSVLVVTVEAANVADPAAVKIGVLAVTILQAAGLKSEDQSSPSSTDREVLTGTFGSYPAPTISSITAADRNTPVQPGISGGDALIMVFDIPTNQPTVSSKSAVDALLSFSSSIGTNYVGNWVSATQLEITILSAAGANTLATAVGTLTVQVKAAGNLRSADESSPQSETSGTLSFGTWGDYPAPAISSVTAFDTGNFPGLSVGDNLRVTFDIPTNTPSLSSKGLVDNVFQFSSPLGSDYDGYWATDTEAVINITDPTGNTPAYSRVGALYLRVRSTGGLKSQDGSSDASVAVGYLDFGSWGEHIPPAVTTATASDSGNQEGISNGDSITVVFDADTNRPGSGAIQEVETNTPPDSGNVGGTFTLTFWGETTTDLSVAATSSAMRTALEALPSIGANGVVVTRTGPSSSGGYRWQLTFTADCRYCHGDMSLLAANAQGVTGFTTVTVTSIRSSLVLLNSDLASIVSFSTSLGASMSARWASERTLSIVLDDVTGVDEFAARPTAFSLTMQSTPLGSPAVRIEDEESDPATGTVTVLGSWGERQPPAISTITAADTGNAPGLNDGDSITVQFDKATNRPAAATTSELNNLFSFSSALGVSYSGTWLSNSQLRITLSNTTGADPLAVRVGVFTLRVLQSGGLTSADTSSDASTAMSQELIGTFGNFPRPRPISAVAANGRNAGLDAGDTVVVTFDIDTNRVSINSDAQVRALFQFSSPVATTLVGEWLDARTARITIVTPRPDVSITNTRIGALSITVQEGGNLLSSDFSSNPARGTVSLTGTWGDWPAPVINSAVAQDTGNAAGLNAGDSVLITFDQNTNTPNVPMSTLLAFNVNLGTLTGTWVSPSQLRVTVTEPSGLPPSQLRVSTLTVTLRTNGNLKSQDQSSPVSTATSGLTGTFGNYPAPAITRVEAVDPAQVDTPGISVGDYIAVTFDISTNQAPLKSTNTFNKAAVDSLFTFSSTLASDYEGKWVSPTELHITVLNVNGADIVGTSVGNLRLTVKEAAALKSADESSPSSTSQGTLSFGTWGDYPAPSIRTMTAYNGGNAGIDAGDYILIDFDVPTNTRPVDTTSALNALLQWSVNLGDITASWVTNRQLRININAAPAVDTESTRVGGLFVELLSAGGLKSLDGSSPAASGVGYLDAGTWGDRSRPNIVSATAANAGNSPGISIGDTITVAFGEDTNRPSRAEVQQLTTAASPGSNVGGTFSLSYRGRSTGPLSASVSAAALQAALRQLPPIGPTGATVSRTGPDSTSGYTWRITFATTVRYPGQTLVADGAGLTGSGANIRVTTPTPGFFLNSDAVTDSITASAPVPWAAIQWVDRRNLLLTIGDVQPLGAGATNSYYEELTRPGFLLVSILESLGVRTADRSSPRAAANVTLSGTWGKKSPPAILSALAADGPPLQPGIGTGDTLTIKFNGATNRPSVDSASAINNLLSFTSPVASLYSAFWVDPGTLTLVLNSVPSSVSPAATRPGRLEVSLKSSGSLVSADRSSDVSTSKATVSGSWGDFPAPTITQALAQDAAGNAATPGLSALDTLTLTFDIDTNTPAAATHAELMALLTFSSPIGEELQGYWNGTRRLVITVVNRGTVSFRDTRIGALKVTVKESAQLRSIDLSSPSSTSSRFVEGSWGPMAAPILESVTARNDGEAAGLNSGDTMEFRFNSDTNTPTLSTHASVLALFTPSASLGRTLSGTWIDSKTLRVRIVDATNADSPPRVVPGALNVTLAVNNAIKTADESSPTAITATGRSVTVTGSWGPYPKPRIVSATALDGGGNQGLGTGDEINIVFDRDTNQRAVDSHSAVLSLVTFSSSIGSQLRGVWRTARELRIIILDASGAAAPHLTRVGLNTGLLTLQLNPSASLRSSDNTSPAADDGASIGGSWGTRAAPLIESLVAIDAANKPGLQSGDVLRFTFDTDTSISPVGTVALINTLLAFQYDIGVGYRATWHTVPTAVTGTLSADGLRITTSGSLVGIVAAGDSIRLGTVSNIPVSEVTAGTLRLSSNITAAAAGQATANRPIFTISRRVLELTLGDTSNVDIRRVKPGMVVAVREAGDLRTSDLSSVPCTDTAELGGTFGPYPPPELISAVAEGTTSEGGEGLSPGDRLRLTFSSDTNTPEVNSSTAIDLLFSFSAELGSDYRGTWLTKDSGVSTSAESVQSARSTATSNTSPAPLAVSGDLRTVMKRGDRLRIGSFVFQVALAGLWDATRVPVFYIGRVGIGGLDTGLETETAVGRRRLDEEAPQPKCGLVEDGDAVTLPVFVLNPRELIIEMVNPPAVPDDECNPEADTTRPGVLEVTVASNGVLRSLDDSSDPATGSQVVTGSWNPPPVIRKIVVSDSPQSPTNGIGPGDTIIIVMNGRVQPLPIATKEEIDAVFAFSSPIGNDYTGEWENDGVAVITIVDATGSGPLAEVAPGTLCIGIRASAELRSVGGDSGVSTSQAVVRGLWGPDEPPRLQSMVAVDGGAPGLGPGDRLQMVFDRATNTPELAPVHEIQQVRVSAGLVLEVQAIKTTAADSAVIGGTFTLKLQGGSVETEPISYRAVPMREDETGGATGFGIGESMQRKLESLPNVGDVLVTRAAAGDGFEWRVTFLTYVGNVPTLQLARNSLTGTGASVQIRTITDAMQVSGSFKLRVGSATTGVIPYDAAPSGGGSSMEALLEALPLVQDVTVQRTVSDAVGGFTWTITFISYSGAVDVPQLQPTAVALQGPDAMINAKTLVNARSSTELIVSLFQFSASIADTMAAAWTSPTTLTITLLDPPELGGTSSRLLAAHSDFRRQLALGSEDQATLNQAQTFSPSVFSAAVVPQDENSLVNLRSASGAVRVAPGPSPPLTLTGSWGARPAPRIASAVAIAGNGGVEGRQGLVDIGDQVRITFDSPTNAPDVSSRCKLERLLRFHPLPACELTASWQSLTVLLITVAQSGCHQPAAAKPGRLSVEVLPSGGLRSVDLSSPAAAQTATVTGSFGTSNTPEVLISASEGAITQTYLGPGDTLTFQFTEPTNQPPTGTIPSTTSISFSVGDEPLSSNVEWEAEWSWEAMPGSVLVSGNGLFIVPLSDSLLTTFYPDQELRVGGSISRVNSSYNPFATPGGFTSTGTTEAVCTSFGANDRSRNVPLSIPLNIPDGAYTVYVRSRTKMQARVVKGTASVAAETLSITIHPQWNLRSADETSSAFVLTNNKADSGNFGIPPPIQPTPIYEESLFWILLVLAIVLIILIVLLWICLRRNYIWCFRNKERGKRVWTPPADVVENAGDMETPKPNAAQGEAIHKTTAPSSRRSSGASVAPDIPGNPRHSWTADQSTFAADDIDVALSRPAAMPRLPNEANRTGHSLSPPPILDPFRQGRPLYPPMGVSPTDPLPRLNVPTSPPPAPYREPQPFPIRRSRGPISSAPSPGGSQALSHSAVQLPSVSPRPHAGPPGLFKLRRREDDDPVSPGRGPMNRTVI